MRARHLLGMGGKTVLGLPLLLRSFCREALASSTESIRAAADDLIDRYAYALADGFMGARESQILSEQEQLRRALSTALESQSRELLVKNHAINTSINGIMLADLDGKVTWVNSAFLAMWKCATAEEVVGSHIDDRAAPSLARGHGTILVVDDEPQVREIVARVLASCGYNVLLASDGAEAIARYAKGDGIDLVVLDVMMPGMGGRECLERLRAANPRVRVMVTTGYTSDGSAQELVREGALCIVEKPLDIKLLVESVAEQPACAAS